MKTLLNDLRYTLRVLRRTPVVTFVAVSSLALGIGANTAIFSVVNAVLLQRLPVESPDRLVAIFTTAEGAREGPFGGRLPMSRPNFEDLQRGNRIFSHMVLGAFTGATLTGDSLGGGSAPPERLGGQIVSGTFFDALGVEATHGRTFLAEEDEVPGRDPVIVLSHGLWSRRFGADLEILGETVTLNGIPFTVIGIAPAGFRGTQVLFDPDFWVPMAMHETLLKGILGRLFDSRRALIFSISFARLAPGVSLERAQEAMAAAGRGLAERFAAENAGRGVGVVPLTEAMIPAGQRSQLARGGTVLTIVVALVLLIACTNVVNLLVARAAARAKEIAVRRSVGAGRAAIVRQMLTEGMALAALAGIAGLLLATWGRALLWALRPPLLEEAVVQLRFDGRVLAFTLAITLVIGLLLGLLPALRAGRGDLVTALKEAAPEARSFSGVLKLRSLLVGGQVALCLVALVTAGLFLRGLIQAQTIDFGFDGGKVMSFTFDLNAEGFDPPRGRQFFDRAVERAAAIPGVERVSLATSVPLLTRYRRKTVFVEGRGESREDQGTAVPVTTVGLDYLDTLGISLVEGRDLGGDDREDSPRVAVVSRAMAERFWPGESAVERRFQFFDADGPGLPPVTVVGVAEDARIESLGEDPQPLIYLPRSQSYSGLMNLLARTEANPEALLRTVRSELQSLDRGVPISNVQPLVRALDQALWMPRTMARLLFVFALLALFLAALGIYGVLYYTVSRRRHEIGIRLALGAAPRRILHLVLRQALVLTAAGVAAGLAATVVLHSFYRDGLAELVYGIDLFDWKVVAGVVAVLVVASMAASLIPARNAAATPPAAVLRSE